MLLAVPSLRSIETSVQSVSSVSHDWTPSGASSIRCGDRKEPKHIHCHCDKKTFIFAVQAAVTSEVVISDRGHVENIRKKERGNSLSIHSSDWRTKVTACQCHRFEWSLTVGCRSRWGCLWIRAEYWKNCKRDKILKSLFTAIDGVYLAGPSSMPT